MSRESRLRLKLESALDDIARMEEANYTQLLSPKIAEALKLIDLLEDEWGIDLEEGLGDEYKYFLEDETDPQQLYDKLCAAKVRKDRNDLARKVLVERRQSSESNFSRRRRCLRRDVMPPSCTRWRVEVVGSLRRRSLVDVRAG